MMSIKIKILGAFSFAREQDRRVVSNGVAIIGIKAESRCEGECCKRVTTNNFEVKEND